MYILVVDNFRYVHFGGFVAYILMVFIKLVKTRINTGVAVIFQSFAMYILVVSQCRAISLCSFRYDMI